MTTEPAWLAAARAKLGTRETPGPTSNSKLLALLNTASKFNGFIWREDAMSWCGGFASACMVAARIDPPMIAARAKSWATWGSALRPDHVAPGAVLVFQRPGGGHVGFYVGENARSYRVLGGNQGDCVSETWIDKTRCIAIRWPKGEPVSGGPVKLAAGGAVSRNEA